MKLKLNIRKKISLFVLVPLSAYIIFLIIFIGISTANQAEFDSGHTSRLLSERSACHAEIVISGYQACLNTLSNALSVSTPTLNDKQRETFNNALLNISQGQKCWALVMSDFYADTNYNNGEWLLIQASANNTTSINDNQNTIRNKYKDILSSSTTLFSDPYELGGKWVMNISTPIYRAGDICGFAGKTVDIKDFDIMSQKVAKAFNEEVTKHLINNKGIVVYSSIDADVNQTFNAGITDSIKAKTIKEQIVKGEYITNLFEQDGKDMNTYFTPLAVGPNCNWSMALTFPVTNITHTTLENISTTIFAAIIGLILMIGLVLWIAKTITSPILNTTKALKLLALGDTESIEELDINTNDELEEMSDSLNQVVEGMRKSESFALEIGEEKFDNDFHTLSDKDRLGGALIKMRDNLSESKKIEAKRKEEEELRNWATEGIAKFAEILRKDQDNLKSLSYNLMSHLVDYLNVNQGALFVLNNDNEEEPVFSLTAAIAYDRDKYMNKDIRIGEGLVGRCVYERKTIYITKVPDNYIQITSGLGNANPSCVLIVPCSLNDEVYGVIEIASFEELKPHEIEFVEKLGESIASTISSVRVTEKTAKLLKASQIQREELASQEEELRQNLEEMQATQEDLRRQMDENQDMKDNLSKEIGLMNSLMDNINDYIYFKDLEGKFIRVSKSYLRLAEVDSYEDVIGKSDFDLCEIQTEAQRYFDDEQRIIKTKKPMLNQIQCEHRFDTTIYTSTSKYPLYDSYGNVIGTFGLTSEITNSILAKGQANNDENK